MSGVYQRYTQSLSVLRTHLFLCVLNYLVFTFRLLCFKFYFVFIHLHYFEFSFYKFLYEKNNNDYIISRTKKLYHDFSGDKFE